MTEHQQEPHSGGPAPPRASRRQFITWLSRAFLGLWGLGAAGVAAAYLRAPHGGERVADRLVRVGLLEDFRIGEGRLIRHGTSPFYVVRVDAQRMVALSAVCTHVRCILDYDSRRRTLVCPCHEGSFDLSGTVLAGPPPRALPRYEVSVRAGEVYVLLS
jgi:Rieske Fe-S protein